MFKENDVVVCAKGCVHPHNGSSYRVSSVVDYGRRQVEQLVGTDSWLQLEGIKGTHHSSLFELATQPTEDKILAGDRLLCVDPSNTMRQLKYGEVYVANSDESPAEADRENLPSVVQVVLTPGNATLDPYFKVVRFVKIGGSIVCRSAPREFIADVVAPIMPTDWSLLPEPVSADMSGYRQWWISTGNREICPAYAHPDLRCAEGFRDSMVHVVDVKLLEQVQKLACGATGWTANRHVTEPLDNIIGLCSLVLGPPVSGKGDKS